MMTNKKELEVALCQGLASEMDAFLGAHRFLREDGSLEYSRQIQDGSQKLKMVFDLNPGYQPSAIASLLPQLAVSLDKVNEIVLEMLGDEPFLVGTSAVTFYQQLQNAAPQEQRCVTWYVFDLSSNRTALAAIREFMRCWTIPFLDQYISAQAIARGHEERDQRLVNDRRFAICVAAAYVSLGQPDRAMKVLADKFRRPGAKHKYAKAFEYVANCVGGKN